MTVLFLNGEFTELESASVSVEDRGFQFGDGVYEGVRIYNGRPFRLDAHLARLRGSAEGIELRLPDLNLREACLETIRRSGLSEGFLYLQVTRGAAPRSHSWSEMDPTILAYVRSIPARSGAWKAITVPDIRWGRCHLKTLNLLPNTLARQKAGKAGCEEAIFVRDGIVTEGSACNVFAVLNGVVRTHPADNRILPGISREIVIGLAGAEENALSLDELRNAGEVFLTGTTTEVTGVVELDGQAIGDGKPGPTTRRLAEAYRELWGRECGS